MRNHVVIVHLVMEYVTTFMEQSLHEWDQCMQIFEFVVAFLNDSAFGREKKIFDHPLWLGLVILFL